MAYTIAISGLSPGKPVMYHITVNLGNKIPPYTINRRYNDFLRLAADVETEMGEPVTVAPPPRPGLFGSVDLEKRRIELETMLTALVRVPDFAECLAVGNFLEIFSHRKAAKSQSSTVDWVHTTTEVSNLVNEARNAQHAPVVRRKVVQAKTLVGQLQRALQSNEFNCGKGELARRQQQLDNYLFALHQVETKRHISMGADELGTAPPSTTSGSNSYGRVLGETRETRKLNNRGLMDHQQSVMSQQDSMIEELQIAVSRQKQLGMEIHTELTKQNDLLESLDEDVHRVNAKLNQARRKTSALNR